MRPTKVTLSAAGNSVWVPLDYLQAPFAVNLGVILSNGAVLTYSAQHTFDQYENPFDISISRTTTVATVTFPSHGGSPGDSLVITNSGSTNLDTQVANIATVIDANTFTYTVANTGATTATAKGQVFRVFNHATLNGLTARADGNYILPVRGSRLAVTSYTSGAAEMTILQGRRS